MVCSTDEEVDTPRSGKEPSSGPCIIEGEPLQPGQNVSPIQSPPEEVQEVTETPVVAASASLPPSAESRKAGDAAEEGEVARVATPGRTESIARELVSILD